MSFVSRAAATRGLALACAFATLAMPARSAATGPGLAPLRDGPQRTALTAYLSAVASGRFEAAFALLTADGRRYFGTAANYASIFRTDRLTIERYRIRGATSTPRGLVASVDETTKYLDAASQTTDEAEGDVLYGVVREDAVYRIKDPYHPWRAMAVAGDAATADSVTVAIRKISFFTGRIEIVATFENRGEGTVTILPYRTIVRDDRGNVLHCLTDRGQPYTDRQIRLGLRLAANSRFTGALAFPTVDRYRPRTLELLVGPLLRDGADEPTSIDLKAIAVAP